MLENYPVDLHEQKEHSMTILNRTFVKMVGVTDVESFDSTTFLLNTVKGHCFIKGENLQLKTLDLNARLIEVEGLIIDVSYMDHQQKKSWFSQYFK
ncbi:hypothetical protein GCM10012290_24420 [Halolactibacillus alkaliphilus]|uniref:Sporulation protein YabP n=1 Tax=Halolactibacillus alkaliphilus TaxID=442899 RepID=A0A511X4H6_9BACI|nr:YabP/YqfC family sporulation protein [Halolactibacillus alkaliphilus]GEN57852.1 hypothetical protein HAL01_23160 [Halolactibacillus alkaliphilus]GGN75536.1 hypothetical protein GCM10012290_24420 [Halolactibacillus alkaliphilus]SFP06689.1 sporulation protein YabP [Halolactibacillus alkaliphilus]